MNKFAMKAACAMLAIQRYPWEQGVCAQALMEAGETELFLAMAYDAVKRQRPDGRLAVINENFAVTDPAANGEPVLRAWDQTQDPVLKDGADKMLDYLKNHAPRTPDGVLYHNEISFNPDFTANQLWVDSLYMAPPFLAAMGEFDDSFTQIQGMIRYLRDDKADLLYHIYDVGTQQFVRKLLWATGNGWALLGLARVRKLAEVAGRDDIELFAFNESITLLNAMLPFQRSDGLFHDVLDDSSTFIDGTSAMMMSAYIFRGIDEGWLARKYQDQAEMVYQTMITKFDKIGFLHDVCGSPNFDSSGTSAEAQAAFIMMSAWRDKVLKL